VLSSVQLSSETGRPIFELRRLTDYSDDAILSELRRVAEAFPDGAVTRTVMEMYDRVSMKKISQRFGSLREAS